MKKRIAFLVVMFLFMLGLSWFTYYSWDSEVDEIVLQEKVSEEVAEKYLSSISQQLVEGQPIIEEPENIDLEYDDRELYGNNTEDEAWGYIDGVLEIPSIELRQAIYSGTPEQIEHDLRNWMSVTSRSDYILGQTHYCIYMHNSRNKTTKISYAQEKIVPGDYMIMTQGQYVYFYNIIDMYAEWRDTCTSDIIDNMATDNDKLYIFTCGREDWANRNLVIEGKLYHVYDLADWEINKLQYINKYKEDVLNMEFPKQKEYLKMTIEGNENEITIDLKTPNNTQVLDCTIGVFNMDGYLVNEDSEYEYNGAPITINMENEGLYTVGVFKNNTEYEIPTPYMVDISKTNVVQSVTTLEEVTIQVENENTTTRYIALTMLGLSFLMFIAALIKTIVDNRKE